ncbi:galactokinase [Teredinibacter haidensis]|uniref:galactokinase n=1 Tax=Teredinibacter haidensis TaxID=2731755 RepID=UPI000948AD2C|nr:galactokinase [Teredinibacter haidensis]
MNHPLERAQQAFSKTFNRDADRLFHAPGRVNLIGEHTDYNNGFVLPTAIDRGTYMAVGLRDDSQINVTALDINGETSCWDANATIEHDQKHSWANYLRGVFIQFVESSHPNIKGMDVVVAGNIPQGAGLSSSASFSVVFATAISEINNLFYTPAKIALLCQAAENQFVGCNCGIMDQLISAAGQINHALLIDCQNLAIEPISVPDSLAVMIIDSKVTRGLVDSEYNDRRKQCELAAKQLNISSLREASLSVLQANRDSVDPIAFKRAHHVITENERTLAMTEALKNNDVTSLSRLMAESHVSMRDDFEITVPLIDYLVELVSSVIGRNGGVRMTGGGFGGCIVCLLPENLIAPVTQAIHNNYPREHGLTAEIHICKASNGAGEITPTV